MGRRKSKRGRGEAAISDSNTGSGKSDHTVGENVTQKRRSKTSTSTNGVSKKGSDIPDANSANRLATKAVLTKDDVTCPICWSILFEPTTLPCNHSLCEVCFRKHIDTTSLSCPCCRKRLSLWVRNTVKDNKMTDEELWTRIKKEFPKHVEARLKGIDTQDIVGLNEDIPASPQLSPLLPGTSKCFDGTIIQTPGKLRKELQQLMEEHEKDMEQERMREETASASLIKHIQEEENLDMLANRNAEKQDLEMAQKLNDEYKAERRLLLSQDKKTPRRNLMEEWVNTNSPDICSLPGSSQTSSQQSKKRLSQQSAKSKKPTSTASKKGKSLTPSTPAVSKASQNVMNKFLSQSQSIYDSFNSSRNAFVLDDNQPCCSSSVPKHDVRFSAFSPTKPSKSNNIFVPSEKLASSTVVQALTFAVEGDDRSESLKNQASEDQVTPPKTPDSINSEVDRHFRPIRSAPKTPPRRRADGTFMPEPKVFRSTPIRPATAVSTSTYISPVKQTPEKASGAIMEKRISNDSGRASDDSRSPVTSGISPSSSGKYSDIVSSTASISKADQIDQGCISEDYRVTPENSTPPKQISKKRSNIGDSELSDESPTIKKVKLERNGGKYSTSKNSDFSFLPQDAQIKMEPESQGFQSVSGQMKRSPLKIEIECSQGLLSVDEDDQEYIDLEREALENFKKKAEQEAKDRAFAEALQRDLNGNSNNNSGGNRNRERYSLRSWFKPEVKIKQGRGKKK